MGANHITHVRVEGSGGLVKIGWGRRQLGHEFIHPTPVVEVNRDDLGRLYRWEMLCSVDPDTITVDGDQLVPLAMGRYRLTVVDDPSELGHCGSR